MNLLRTGLFFLLLLGALASGRLRAQRQAQLLGLNPQTPSLFVAPPDALELRRQDSVDAVHGLLPKAGRILPLNADLGQALWTTTPTHRVAQLRIISPGALALHLYLEDLFLSPEAELWIYAPNQSQVMGPLRAANLRPDGLWATGLIGRDDLVLELHEPLATPTPSRLRVAEVGYIYRMHTEKPGHWRNTDDFADSDDCQVNINCSEGAAWAQQRDATVRILVRVGFATGWCSGVLVNNTAEDYTPYVLTALHCGLNDFSGNLASNADFNNWLFYFNYQASSCTTPPSEGSLDQFTVVGADARAHTNDGGGDTGPDMLLLELDQNVPDSYAPFFAGWDRTNTAPSSGVGIHHPAGDIKKISTFTTTALSTSWGQTVSNTHWLVQWKPTTNGHGVTEGGSSGSPLFNQNKRVVGTLTGGGSFCNDPLEPDAYGKFNLAWNSMGSTPDRQLAPWLDPLSLNPFSLDGTYKLSARPAMAGTEPLQARVYANGTQGQFVLEMANSSEAAQAQVLVFNAVGGRMAVPVAYVQGSNRFQLDLGGLSTGIYFVHVRSNGRTFVQKVQV